VVNIKEFYLYNQSLNCYCSGFLYGQAELTNVPTKINEVELQAAIRNGFNCDERWVIK
ncbi:putative phage protein, partial [Oenococcus oeni AWRIB202]